MVILVQFTVAGSLQTAGEMCKGLPGFTRCMRQNATRRCSYDDDDYDDDDDDDDDKPTPFSLPQYLLILVPPMP